MVAFSLTETMDNMYSTTWRNVRADTVDQIFTATPFYYYMSKNNRVLKRTGGRALDFTVQYAKNATIGWLGRGETVDTSDTEFLSRGTDNWKYLVGSIVRYHTDDQENRGEQAIKDLVREKMENLKMSLVDDLETKLFQAFGSIAANEPNSLDYYIREDPTASATVSGIAQDTYSWWQNKIKDMVNLDVSVQLLDQLRTMINNCSSGLDRPNLLVADQSSFEKVEDETLEQKIITQGGTGDAMFDTIRFHGLDIVWSPSAVANSIYVLNLRYLRWITNSDFDFNMTEWKPAQNNLDRVAQVVAGGQLQCTQRRKQGVLFNIGE